MFPKISIVTPSFNQGQYIEQTIDSILSQNYPNLEYLIIDGGSKDDTVEIIKKYQKHLTYWISEPDQGQSDAINKGLALCTGDVFNWLNSDDYYEYNTLQIVGEAFRDINCHVFCGRSRIFKGDQTLHFSSGTDVYSDNLAKTIGWARIDQPETFIRKSILDKIGMVNQEMHYIMDKELWMRILFQNGLDGIVLTDKVLANFRLHESSKTVSFAEKFAFETDSLFFALAKAYGYKMEMEGIKNNLDIKEGVHSTLLFGQDKDLVLNSITYFLLHRFEQLYAINKFNTAKALVPYIDTERLKKPDVDRMNSILWKLILPPIFKKLYNRVKN